MSVREMTWAGMHNARCLGGLPAAHAGRAVTTVAGRVFRSPVPSGLSATTWTQIARAVRTVVDLRNPGEGPQYAAPDGVLVHRRPIEDQGDADFMRDFGELLGTPRYYGEVLLRWPDLIAEVFRTIAHAPPGGVLVHCAAGRDRTGQISAMLLSLVGVAPDAIADDYELAVRARNAHLREHPLPHDPAIDDDRLDATVTGLRTDLLGFLHGLDVADYLRGVGLTDADLDALRGRLLNA